MIMLERTEEMCIDLIFDGPIKQPTSGSAVVDVWLVFFLFSCREEIEL